MAESVGLDSDTLPLYRDELRQLRFAVDFAIMELDARESGAVPDANSLERIVRLRRCCLRILAGKDLPGEE